MRVPVLKLPAISDHASEVSILYVMAGGVIFLLWRAVERDKLGDVDVAAFLLVLVRIIEAITAKWTQRSLDRSVQQLGASSPNGSQK